MQSKPIIIPPTYKPARFWARLDTTGDCWEWRGATTAGYGRVTIGGQSYVASRVAYFLAHGELPTGLHVCHICDNPPCCRPEHLFLGTDKENAADKVAKGRFVRVYTRGELNGQARLTNEQACEIARRYAAGEVLSQIAHDYDIARPTAHDIAVGRKWSSVTGIVYTPRGKAYGERLRRHRLTEAGVREARRRRKAGEKLWRIADDLGVSIATVSLLCNRKIWAHIPDDN